MTAILRGMMHLMRSFGALALLSTLLTAGTAAAQTPGAAAPAAAPDGADLYKRTCAQCHDNGVGRAPNREAFRAMLPDRVLSAMESGSMVSMATGTAGFTASTAGSAVGKVARAAARVAASAAA